jgi:hypothetical protein
MQNKMNSQMSTSNFGPYADSDEVKGLQEMLNTYNFNLEVDGMYGPKTRKADNLYSLYMKNNFTDEEIKKINNPDVSLRDAPIHLLEQGNKELFMKSIKNPFSLTDKEYKMAFPNAKTNAQYLSETFEKIEDKVMNYMKKQ